MKILIVIPARYGSTRFPGKPLVLLGGRSMLSHVVEKAREAIAFVREGSMESVDIDLLIATDDERIMAHAADLNTSAILTPASCKTGTDRVLAAIRQLPESPDYVLCLQGDVPLIPSEVVRDMIRTMLEFPHLDVVTPVHNLSWEDLDRLRAAKEQTPFSGTTVIMDDAQRAVWFSKNIIPAIRKEDSFRASLPMSPVWRHIGVYGYRVDILERFSYLEEGFYEQLEGLEQLRLLENHISIQCVPVTIPAGALLSGIDSPEDLARAEAVLQQAAAVARQRP
ncbi:MAG: 3-deoxy-manno-octulosonate cytidylyltransferase [Rhodospirillales bacterium]|nr:3-deoxy-manno-octulosonate cytidylyltransferase [Rhodospirillales bacterium]MCB9965664.1 3-deoxy-manno-octulosonate cytidylyltransferase [Rhodospirillales bacterium]MCB9973090.1 3-deoxy-manno-octulosonate cytidylyltransferase [Rhodospirillales bacterium]